MHDMLTFLICVFSTVFTVGLVKVYVLPLYFKYQNEKVLIFLQKWQIAELIYNWNTGSDTSESNANDIANRKELIENYIKERYKKLVFSLDYYDIFNEAMIKELRLDSDTRLQNSINEFISVVKIFENKNNVDSSISILNKIREKHDIALIALNIKM